MKNSLRILFLASWYPNKRDPNLGNFVQRHAEAIGEKHEVYAVSAVPWNEPFVDRVQRGNLTEYVVYYRNELPFLSYIWSLWKGIRMARKAAGKFDICHVNVTWPAGFIALFLKIPYILTEHFSGYTPERNHKWSPIVKFLTRRILEKAHTVAPVSEFLKEAMMKFAPNAHFRVIPNVVNESLFKYETPPEKGPFKFLHISSLENQSKNVTGMLESLQKVVLRGRSDFNVKIGGDGDSIWLSNQMAIHSLTSNRFVIVEDLEPYEVAQHMSEAHALLMFSHYETQSCTILESLCSGRPVVTSAVGGIPEITDESNSIQVEDNDVIGLAIAIETMIDNYERFDTESISKDALRRYSYIAVANTYDQVYSSALKRDA